VSDVFNALAGETLTVEAGQTCIAYAGSTVTVNSGGWCVPSLGSVVIDLRPTMANDG